MKKKLILIFIFVVIFITSCNMPDDFYDKYDGIPFEKVDEFTSGDKTYDLLLATETKESLAYYYKTINNKSSKETWIINYSDQADYISEYVLEGDLYNSVYNILLKNKTKIETRIESSISLYKNRENMVLEQVLKNDLKEEIGCIIIGEYLPIIVSNSTTRYLIFIPINAYICVYKDEVVYDFMGHSEITIEELVNELKILER